MKIGRRLLVLVAAAMLLAGSAVSAEEKIPWWDQWPRFTDGKFETCYGNVTISGNNWDAGQTLLYVDHTLNSQSHANLVSQNEANGVRRLAWLEGQGDTRCMVIALHKLPNGEYEINPETGAARIIADRWRWASAGPAVNANANEVVWLGIAPLVNREPYMGKYAWPEDLPLPTYPDGSSCLGYKNDDRSDPRNAYVYDALAAKDLNGEFRINEPSSCAATEEYKMTYGTADNPRYTQDFYFSKDMACPWWLEYSRIAIRRQLEDGVSGFWVDNYCGWDYINSNPLSKGFGEWTVAGFRDYIKQHNDVLQIEDPDNFDIRQYLKDRFREMYPDRDPNNLSDSGWASIDWLDDMVWKAFCAYKADISHQRMKELYAIVKEEAQNLGLDPDEILVCGNDISKLSFGGERETCIDMVSTEYSTLGWTPDKRFYCDGIAPYGSSGTFYKNAIAFGKSQHSNVWYYMDTRYQQMPGLGEVCAYEGMANNTIIKMGGTGRAPGTPESARKVFENMERMAPVFGRRWSSAKIALVSSPQSSAYVWSPVETGYSGKVPHTLDFNGWGMALEDYNIPYKVLTDYQLTADKLEDVELLVLPSVVSISEEQVTSQIVPFVKNGGKLIITGSDSGSIDTSENMWLKHERPILADLASDPELAANIYYDANRLGMEYYLYKNTMFNVDKSFDYLFILDTTYKVSAPVYKGADGQTITSLAGQESVDAQVTFRNDTLYPTEVTFYAQLTDENGWSSAGAEQTYTAQPNTDTQMNIHLDIPEGADSDELELFIWRDTEPLAVSMSLDNPTPEAVIKNTALDTTLQTLGEDGFLPDQFSLHGFNSYTNAVLYEREDGKMGFIDLVNRNYNVDDDTIIPASEGVLDIRLERDADFLFYDADLEQPVALQSEKLANGMTRIYVPSFRVYGSVAAVYR